MWHGKVTEELRQLADEYYEVFDGYFVDGYEELCYDAMTYEQFVDFIKEALRQGQHLPDVVP